MVNEKREMFLDALVEYLVGNEVEKSIALQMGKPEAKLWSYMRNATPLFGYYPDKEKAKMTMKAFLGWE